jgi:periplasmic divalent cation tolerance protein
MEAQLSQAIVVWVTLPSAEAARQMATTLVEERLAACGNVLPGIQSIYRWEGEVQQAEEVLLILKSTEEKFEPLRARVVELHGYECPEVIRLDVAAGHAPYLAWIAASVSQSP